MNDLNLVIGGLLLLGVTSSAVWAIGKTCGDGGRQRQAITKGKGGKTVTIVVLGDFGRSPRMQYHAESFVQQGWIVRVVAYHGVLEISSLRSSSLVHFHYLKESFGSLSKSRNRMIFLLLAPCKVMFQIMSLVKALMWDVPPSDFLLVQTPPAIPTLAIAQMASYLRNQKLIIDWHNLGYTILALSLGKGHPVVRIGKALESYLGRRAYAHIAVTRAMLDYLKNEWSIEAQRATVLYDCPPNQFQRTSLPDRDSVLEKYDLARFVTKDSVIVVSSTSWTADEDFGILLDSMSYYHEKSQDDGLLPPLAIFVTGKGPLKAMFESKIRQLELAWQGPCRISIALPWLEADDYPRLLGSADLGICLHTSSSGLDLPMKVVDMFGCGLPVCAYSYPCLTELVQDRVNGRLFKDAQDLGLILTQLLRNKDELKSMSHSASNHFEKRWKHNWEEIMLPLLQ